MIFRPQKGMTKCDFSWTLRRVVFCSYSIYELGIFVFLGGAGG